MDLCRPEAVYTYSIREEVTIMRKWILLAGLCFGLAGCATPEQRAEQVAKEVDNMIATYGPACERLGYSRNDDNWRNCVLRLAARDDRRYYASQPVMTNCIGHRGFFHCTTF
jgi:hypothetical protein